MCLNCGCGEPEERHKDSDITMEDVRQAASGGEMPLDQTVHGLGDPFRPLYGRSC